MPRDADDPCPNTSAEPSVRILGPNPVYTSIQGRIMDNIVEHSDEGEFANGQISRDLRVNSDRTEPQTQEAVNIMEQPEGFRAPENPEREQHGAPPTS